MKALLTLFLIALSGAAFSQALVSEALRVKEAYEKLMQNPHGHYSQTNYIESFPSNSDIFLKVFNSRTFDQLYPVYDKYMDAFQRCAGSYPKEVISKCVDIGKDLVWDADAVASLQQISVMLAGKHPRVFVQKYNTLTEQKKKSLIRFYADVENHHGYPEYQVLIDSLRRIGVDTIAKSLEKARTEREKMRDH